MSAAVATPPPLSAALRLLEVRVLPEFCAFWHTRPWLSSVSPRGDGHPVLVLPGLTSALPSFLNPHRYNAHGWKQGRNFGLRPNLARDMLARTDELIERHSGRKLSRVGWSLGRLYARQLAKIAPDKVHCLISLGSRFAGSPKSTNAWKTYELVSGSKIEDQDGLGTWSRRCPFRPPPSSAAPTASVGWRRFRNSGTDARRASFLRRGADERSDFRGVSPTMLLVQVLGVGVIGIPECTKAMNKAFSGSDE